ncbi:MAG TPA: hypothetical protein VJ246_00690 [Patescibacteria group bacterium]|nr:hypothetical protein [Patescibacteria group bacterium]
MPGFNFHVDISYRIEGKSYADDAYEHFAFDVENVMDSYAATDLAYAELRKHLALDHLTIDDLSENYETTKQLLRGDPELFLRR